VCARYTFTRSRPDAVAAYFDVTRLEASIPPSWNVAPTDDVYTILEADEQRRLDVFRWGLVPGWAKDIRIGARLINARAETVATNNSFKNAFRGRRALIPADGFYEWKPVPGQKRKQPMYVQRADGDPIAFAGLWSEWHGPDRTGEPLHTCTIITTTPNETMAPIHDRMPVILPPSAWDAWLDPANDDTEALGRLLVPAPAELLTVYPVSTAVNYVRNDGPELITEATGDQLVG